MIDIQTFGVWGFEGAIWGMRAAHESWEKSDSLHTQTAFGSIEREENDTSIMITHGIDYIGDDDIALMKKLATAGDDHGKFLRCIHVQAWIKAPIRWWVEMDTYKVSTVRLSTSLMHKAIKEGFHLGDFSVDHINSYESSQNLLDTVEHLNKLCDEYQKEYATEKNLKVPHVKSKRIWYEIQELVPRCYNYGSILDLNYATLRRIAHSDRKGHKQDEWREGFFDWMHTLPLAEELIFSPYSYEKPITITNMFEVKDD